jgi:hypothetical protein
MKKIYVAGPYTKGDVAVNVRNAIDMAHRLANLGYWPFVPHLSHFWHMLRPRPYEFWCELDNVFLPHCDALLRLPGESKGADAEVKLAESLGIPVHYCTFNYEPGDGSFEFNIPEALLRSTSTNSQR